MRSVADLRKRLPLVAICAGTFIVIVALPDIAGGLHTSLQDFQWVLDLYALVLASLVLTAGSIAGPLRPA
jgi:hypothetical protein